jgi:MFS family permease
MVITLHSVLLLYFGKIGRFGMQRSPFVILFFTVFLDLVGFGIVLPLLPNYARELGASPLEIGIIAGSYSVMQFFSRRFGVG